MYIEVDSLGNPVLESTVDLLENYLPMVNLFSLIEIKSDQKSIIRCSTTIKKNIICMYLKKIFRILFPEKCGEKLVKKTRLTYGYIGPKNLINGLCHYYFKKSMKKFIYLQFVVLYIK